MCCSISWLVYSNIMFDKITEICFINNLRLTLCNDKFYFFISILLLSIIFIFFFQFCKCSYNKIKFLSTSRAYLW